LVPHLIFALHGLVFFILFDLVFLGIMMYLFHFQQLGDRYILFVFIVMVIWCTLAVKRVYDLRMLPALFTGPIVAMAFFILLNYYRQAITIWSLWHYSG
jgi:hypothetical protein